MSVTTFSLPDYQIGFAAGHYYPPDIRRPYYMVDPKLYLQYGTTDQRRGKLRNALQEVQCRTGWNYFGKTYPLQARTLMYSAKAFPAYRFILPEVMTEDWLAIVDWGKFQRDHVLHQPLCGYVILKLLELTLANGSSLLDECVNKILRWKETTYIRDFLIHYGISPRDPIIQSDNPVAHRVWRIWFREAAYMAAIFHDLGYPWQYAERLQCNLDGINTPAIRPNSSAEQIIELFKYRLLFYVLNGYKMPEAVSPSTWHEKIRGITNMALTQTHGFPGALGFLHLNDCIRKYPSPRESPMHLLCIEWAALAIMMHDMTKVYWGSGSKTDTGTPDNSFLRLNFDRDPLSAIVALTDIIQDFERPSAVFNTDTCPRCPNGVLLRYDIACDATELEVDTHSATWTIRYRMKDTRALARKLKTIAKENRSLFDYRYGYFDISSLEINKMKLTAVLSS